MWPLPTRIWWLDVKHSTCTHRCCARCRMSRSLARSSCHRGVGRESDRCSSTPRHFALSAGYRKLVIQVRASNAPALFYRRLGFVECGRLASQVVIDGCDDDEIILEMFLV